MFSFQSNMTFQIWFFLHFTCTLISQKLTFISMIQRQEMLLLVTNIIIDKNQMYCTHIFFYQNVTKHVTSLINIIKTQKHQKNKNLFLTKCVHLFVLLDIFCIHYIMAQYTADSLKTISFWLYFNIVLPKNNNI